MFCCLTGLRKSDALSLRPADIQEYDGTYYIHKVMKKTQTLLHIPLSEEALEILKQEYEDGDSPFFSHLSPYHLNQHLKTWLSENGIDSKPITFHVGSHSKFFYLLNISELSILKNVTANDLETSYILFLSQLCNIQRTL